jgi:hypothetical protein
VSLPTHSQSSAADEHIGGACGAPMTKASRCQGEMHMTRELGRRAVLASAVMATGLALLGCVTVTRPAEPVQPQGPRARAAPQIVQAAGQSCDNGAPRWRNGRCPGTYYLESRIDQNSLVITASAMAPGAAPRPIPGVSVTYGDNWPQHPPSVTTDAQGEARFDLSTEPFVTLLAKGGPPPFGATGHFQDGTVARSAAISLRDTTQSVQMTAQERASSELATKIAEERSVEDAQCQQGNGPACFAVAKSLYITNPNAAVPYVRKACDLHVQQACDAIVGPGDCNQDPPCPGTKPATTASLAEKNAYLQPRFRSWSEATDSERMHSERPLRVRPTGA